jgi:hypothetical protein
LADKLSEEYKGNTNENATAFWRDSLRSFRPVVQSVLSSFKATKKRDFVKILMKRTRVETESDENKRVDKQGKTDCRRTSRSFGPPFLRSFLPFFQSFLNFVAPVLRCLVFFTFFLLLLLFSRVCYTPEFYVARGIKLFFLSFFLSERVFLKNEREERERKRNRNLRLSLGFFGVDSQNGKSEREREILLLCSRKRRRQTRE